MKKNPNIDTNYYLQRRYESGEIETGDISFEPDTSSPIHVDYNQETVLKGINIENLNTRILESTEIKSIIDNIPVGKTVILTVENVNKIYSFCLNLLKTDELLKDLTKVEMFDLITSYLNLEEKEVRYFYKNLSIRFKSELLAELEKQGMYKSNRLF